MGEKVKMIFEVTVDKDFIIDDETLADEYGGDIKKSCEYLYKEEGQWWDEELILTDAIIN